MRCAAPAGPRGSTEAAQRVVVPRVGVLLEENLEGGREIAGGLAAEAVAVPSLEVPRLARVDDLLLEAADAAAQAQDADGAGGEGGEARHARVQEYPSVRGGPSAIDDRVRELPGVQSPTGPP